MLSRFCPIIKIKIHKIQKSQLHTASSHTATSIFPLFKPFLLHFCTLFLCSAPPFSPWSFSVAFQVSPPILLFPSLWFYPAPDDFPSAYPHCFLYILNKNQIFSRQPSKFISLFFGKIHNKISIFTQITTSDAFCFSVRLAFDRKIAEVRQKMITFDKILSGGLW